MRQFRESRKFKIEQYNANLKIREINYSAENELKAINIKEREEYLKTFELTGYLNSRKRKAKLREVTESFEAIKRNIKKEALEKIRIINTTIAYMKMKEREAWKNTFDEKDFCDNIEKESNRLASIKKEKLMETIANRSFDHLDASPEHSGTMYNRRANTVFSSVYSNHIVSIKSRRY